LPQELLAAAKDCCSKATTATAAYREGTLPNLKSKIKRKGIFLPFEHLGSKNYALSEL